MLALLSFLLMPLQTVLAVLGVIIQVSWPFILIGYVIYRVVKKKKN